MNIDLYSDRAKQAVQSAQSLALARGHQQFAPEHLLKVLLEEKDGLSRALIQSAGGRPDAVDAATETLLAKTPLSVLIFFAAGVVYSLKEGRKSHIWVYAPLILYFTFALNSKLQIGVRHILPALPFCLVLAGAGAAALLDRKYPRWAAAFLLAALVIYDAVSGGRVSALLPPAGEAVWFSFDSLGLLFLSGRRDASHSFSRSLF